MNRHSLFSITEALKRYEIYLKLERSLSKNTVAAYMMDMEHFLDFLATLEIDFHEVEVEILRQYIQSLNKLGLSVRSQARMVSGIKAFYKYMLIIDEMDQNPAELLDMPKLPKYLPEVLTLEEIDALEGAIDRSKHEGQRDLAIIETLYGSGIRVSELTGQKLSNLHIDEKFMLVEGKGNKQRLVPLSDTSIKHIKLWLVDRTHWPIKPGNEDFLFLNRRGAPLTRAMIFTIVKRLAAMAGIHKNISPHTFRHSFATHLLEGGANLVVIQKLLGHEDLSTTEIYTHIDMTLLREEILTKHPRNMGLKTFKKEVY